MPKKPSVFRKKHNKLQSCFLEELKQPGVLDCFADISLQDVESVLRVPWKGLYKLTGMSTKDCPWMFDAVCRGEHAWLTWDTVQELREELMKMCSDRLKRCLYRAQVMARENRKLYDPSTEWMYNEQKPLVETEELWCKPDKKAVV